MQTAAPFAFVLMPFDDEFNDLYRFGIKETAKQLGIVAERVDEQLFREGILDRIYRQIDAADIIIAEMTGQNANVFYEVGFAHGRNKLVILSTTEPADIPFDLKHRRHIIHGGSIQTLRERLTEELTWALQEINTVKRSKVQVTLRSIAAHALEKTQLSAKATIELVIDLNNDSDRASPEIEAIYFYSGDGWTLEQDGKQCPWTPGDLPAFSVGRRHFLASPVRRLQSRSGWAQLRFRCRKTLASKFQGEEIKDSYRVNGVSLLRLVTSEGHFDYELPIDVTVEEIPF